MGDFWDAWWQQTYQVKSIVLGHVRTLRTTYNNGNLPEVCCHLASQSLPLCVFNITVSSAMK